MERILVVDDSISNLNAITRVLEKQYGVYTASSGEECLDSIINCQPDLIVLDVNMPGMNGYDTCRNIKNLGYTEHIPIIFVSACCSVEEKIEGYRVGGDDYIAKPFQNEEVLAKIAKSLEHKEDKIKLSQLAQEATNVALAAMNESSHLGECIRFLESSFACKEVEELIELLFEAVAAYGINTSVQVRIGGDVINCEWDGEDRELESALLTKLADSGRYLELGPRSVMNFPRISLLIKNMPLDEEKRFGIIKDQVMILLQSTDARIGAICHERELLRQKQYLYRLIEKVREMLEQTDKEFLATVTRGANIVEEVNEELEIAVFEADLQEHQEKNFIEIGQRGLRKTEKVFSNVLGLDSKFSKILEELEGMRNVAQDPGQSSQQAVPASSKTTH